MSENKGYVGIYDEPPRSKKAMRQEWVVYDGEDLTFYETEQEAKEQAEKAIAAWRRMAANDGEWPYEVQHVWCAKVIGTAKEIIHEGDDERAEYEYQLEWHGEESQLDQLHSDIINDRVTLQDVASRLRQILDIEPMSGE